MKRTKYELEYKQGRGMLNFFPDSWSKHFWNYMREKINQKIISIDIKRKKILVIGAGGLGALPSIEGDIIGLDVNKKLLFKSKKIDNSKKYIAADASNLPFKDASMDIVLCEFVLHHLEGQKILKQSLTEFHRILKKEGKLIAFEPNFLHPSGLLLNLVNKFKLYNKLLGGSDYEFALLPQKLVNLMKPDFSEIDIEPFTYSYARFPIKLNEFIISNEKKIKKSILRNFHWAFYLESKK